MKTFEELQKQLKTLSPEERKIFIWRLSDVCDRDFGGEVDPSDVFDPNEMMQMFLIDASVAQMVESYNLTIVKR